MGIWEGDMKRKWGYQASSNDTGSDMKIWEHFLRWQKTQSKTGEINKSPDFTPSQDTQLPPSAVFQASPSDFRHVHYDHWNSSGNAAYFPIITIIAGCPQRASWLVPRHMTLTTCSAGCQIASTPQTSCLCCAELALGKHAWHPWLKAPIQSLVFSYRKWIRSEDFVEASCSVCALNKPWQWRRVGWSRGCLRPSQIIVVCLCFCVRHNPLGHKGPSTQKNRRRSSYCDFWI